MCSENGSEAEDTQESNNDTENDSKETKIVIFCALHKKKHINKHFAWFYPQDLLLWLKELKKNMYFHSENGLTTYYLWRHIS